MRENCTGGVHDREGLLLLYMAATNECLLSDEENIDLDQQYMTSNEQL